MMDTLHQRSDLGQMFAQPFQIGNDRQTLEYKDGEIQDHAHGYFPEKRMRIPVNHGVPEAFWFANVKDQGQRCHGVADQTDERRGPCNWLIALETKQVHARA